MRAAPGGGNRRTHELKKEVQRARQLAKKGEELCPVVWVIDGALAVVQRPLRDHPEFGGSGCPMRPEAKPEVMRWTEELKRIGFCSTLCLSHEKELAYYDPLKLHSDGLLGFLFREGFDVAHVPALDPAHGKTQKEREARRAAVKGLKLRARKEFDRLPKPVAMFCSAGIDRSSPIAAYIATESCKQLLAEARFKETDRGGPPKI